MPAFGDPLFIKIITRQSDLALWQAHFVGNRLQQQFPHLHIEYIPILTEGDRWLSAPLSEQGGKGLFVKELEQALLEKKADIAVHSLKDMPALLPEGLCLAAITERAAPWDVLLTPEGLSWQQLPRGAKIGTSSLRRAVQLRALRQDLKVLPLRGNVPTRLRKLNNSDFDGIILAQAGLDRLGLHEHPRQAFSALEMLPAVGQGVIGIECRSDDLVRQQYLAALHHESTAACIVAERAMNVALNGGCQIPLAAFAEHQGSVLILRARVGCLNGRAFLEAEAKGSPDKSADLGRQVAEKLLAQGAGEIIEQIRISAGFPGDES